VVAGLECEVVEVGCLLGMRRVRGESETGGMGRDEGGPPKIVPVGLVGG
jgi:hypothetical protein